MIPNKINGYDVEEITVRRTTYKAVKTDLVFKSSVLREEKRIMLSLVTLNSPSYEKCEYMVKQQTFCDCLVIFQVKNKTANTKIDSTLRRNG